MVSLDANKIYEERKVAIHLLRSGVSKSQVASRLNRSLGWVHKWWNRYNEKQDFVSLRDRSRAPQHVPRKISEEICQEVQIARSELEAEKAEGKTKVSINVEAVRERLREKGLKNVPSTKSIERILKRTGMSVRRRVEYKETRAHIQNVNAQNKTNQSNTDRQRTALMAASKTRDEEVMTLPRQVQRKNASRSESHHTKQDSTWLLQLIQGKIGLAELDERLSGKLDSEEIRRLLDCVLNSPLRYRNRAAIILAYLCGVPKARIASSLLVSRIGIDKCLQRYKLKGLEESLNPSWNVPRKSDDPRYEEAIFKILHAPPSSYGINRSTWRMEDIKSVMAEQGLHLSIGNIRKVIKNAGYRFRTAKKVLTSNDPDYKEKVQHIKNILANLGPKEKFFSIDEFGPLSIKLQGGRSLVPPGEVKTIPQYQKSKGSLIMTGALELSTNQMTHFYSGNKNTQEMLKLLEILLKEYQDAECLYLSWDAARWHSSKKFEQKVEEINSVEYRGAHDTPLVKLAPLPAGAQFLNVIESVFSGMARAIIHNSDYASVEECMKAIDRYLSERNRKFKETPKRAGNKIWGEERVKPEFNESNNCKDPNYR
jgi:transposase